MVQLLLDIGAGGSSFVRRLRGRNAHLKMSFLCGEPEYEKNLPDLAPVPRKIEMVQALYDRFGFESGMLDIVTLNAPHPLSALAGLENELVRCLKQGGFFISAHPIGNHPGITSRSLEEVGTFLFSRVSWWSGYEAQIVLGTYGAIRYPVSRTILERLHVLKHIDAYVCGDALNGYMYRNSYAYPTIRVWKRR